jgi:hypothetical protein
MNKRIAKWCLLTIIPVALWGAWNMLSYNNAAVFAQKIVFSGANGFIDERAFDAMLAVRFPEGTSFTKFSTFIENVGGTCDPFADLDFRVLSVDSVEGLPKTGRKLVIVALVGTDLAIRVFDADGKIVIDKTEARLEKGDSLTVIKEQLPTIPHGASLLHAQYSKFIHGVGSLLGHIPSNELVKCAVPISATICVSYGIHFLVHLMKDGNIARIESKNWFMAC